VAGLAFRGKRFISNKGDCALCDLLVTAGAQNLAMRPFKLETRGAVVIE
jgi:hypothetical protein